MDRPTKLTFLTGNAGKLREFQAIMKDVAGLEVTNRGDVEIDEIQGTIEEIARDKARRGAAAVRSCRNFLELAWINRVADGMSYKIGESVLTEDTALEFQALKGLPGPYMYVPLDCVIIIPAR